MVKTRYSIREINGKWYVYLGSSRISPECDTEYQAQCWADKFAK